MGEEPSTDPVDDDDAAPQGDQSPSSSQPADRGYPDEPVLPSVTRDERDVGWGDQPSGYSDEWYLSERPPHHD